MLGIKKKKKKLTLPPEIIRCKVIRRLIIEVINKPAMAQGTVRNVCGAQFLAGIDQVICLVQCLEG